MNFLLKYFDDLSVHELYDVLQLREEVFQMEQTCIYKDLDDKDKLSWHLLLYHADELVAYARLLPEGVSYTGYSSIGRVVSKTRYRKEGFGRQLMQEAMTQLQHLFADVPVKISAQAYLQQFYESFGFQRISEPYLEDDIPHIAMVKE